jgi:hypothetical protein
MRQFSLSDVTYLFFLAQTGTELRSSASGHRSARKSDPCNEENAIGSFAGLRGLPCSRHELVFVAAVRRVMTGARQVRLPRFHQQLG